MYLQSVLFDMLHPILPPVHQNGNVIMAKIGAIVKMGSESKQVLGSPGFCLRVKNLPGVLSSDAVSSLLSHYGAHHVKLLKDALPVPAQSKRKSQTAIAAFPTSDAREKALERLRKLQLAGHHVRAELLVGDGDAAGESQSEQAVADASDVTATVSPSQPPLPRDPPPPPLPPAQPHRAVGIGHSYYAPAPLAPHLG